MRSIERKVPSVLAIGRMRRSTPFFFNWLSDPSRVRFAPGSLFYTAGPGFRWSILNYGRITNNVRAQDARFQQALVNYENTVLNASKEVEDALIGFLKDQESAAALQRSVDTAQSSVELSIIQYREGAENFQRVIDSQTSLLTERIAAGAALNMTHRPISVWRGRGEVQCAPPHAFLLHLGRRL